MHPPKPKPDGPVLAGLIGTGNVAWNLAAAFRGTRCHVVQVIARNPATTADFAAEFGIEDHGTAPSALRKDLDLVLLATSDLNVPEAARALGPHKGPRTVFAHTSGSVPVTALDRLGPNTGVFYPMQTFTRGHPADFRDIPIFLEGAPEVLRVLRPVADLLSARVHTLDSEGRRQLHIGAVFASNFANFMWLLAEEVLDGEEGLSLDVYAGLIRECVEKALTYGPKDAQTGPARRGDAATIEKHLAQLSRSDPGVADLYRTISEMIRERFPEDAG